MNAHYATSIPSGARRPAAAVVTKRFFFFFFKTRLLFSAETTRSDKKCERKSGPSEVDVTLLPLLAPLAHAERNSRGDACSYIILGVDVGVGLSFI